MVRAPMLPAAVALVGTSVTVPKTIRPSTTPTHRIGLVRTVQSNRDGVLSCAPSQIDFVLGSTCPTDPHFALSSSSDSVHRS